MPKRKIKKTKEAKIPREYKIANILVLISVWFLIIIGLFSVMLNKEIYDASKDIAGLGVTPSFFLTYGIIWAVLGILMLKANNSIKKTDDSAMKWFLCVLGLTALLTGRLTGILVIAASLMYIFKKKK